MRYSIFLISLAFALGACSQERKPSSARFQPPPLSRSERKQLLAYFEAGPGNLQRSGEEDDGLAAEHDSKVVAQWIAERDAALLQQAEIFRLVVDEKLASGDYQPFDGQPLPVSSDYFLHRELRVLEDGTQVVVVIARGEDEMLDEVATATRNAVARFKTQLQVGGLKAGSPL